jgi:hypothetical protein
MKDRAGAGMYLDLVEFSWFFRLNARLFHGIPG